MLPNSRTGSEIIEASLKFKKHEYCLCRNFKKFKSNYHDIHVHNLKIEMLIGGSREKHSFL